MLFKRLAVATAIAGLPFAAQAADTTFSELVIKASKDEDKATAVPQTELQGARATTSDTASLLRDVPGVSLYGAGGVSSLPSIHGLADDRLRIKVDGMDLIASCPNHMNSPLSYLDPTNIGTVKVWAGITPVSVGGDSIGGTIVVDTPAPMFAAPGQGKLFRGEAGAFYRSNGNSKGANLAATYATESFSLNYAAATAESDNYTAGGNFKTRTDTGVTGHTLPLDEVGSTAYKTRNQTLGLALKGDNSLVEAKVGYQDIPYELYPNQRMDMLGNTERRFSLRYLGQLTWGTLEARAYRETVDHYMNFGPDKQFWYGTPATIPGMPMNTASTNIGANIKANIDLSKQDVLRVGGDYQHYTLDDWWSPSGGGMAPNSFLNINNGKRDRAALFGEWERQQTAQWMTLLGLRYEHVMTNADAVHGYNLATFPTAGTPAGMMNQTRDAANFNNANRDKTDNNWDLSALARYTANANNDIEFGFAHKVRSPNLYERYSWSTANMMAAMNNFVGDGNGYIGDVNLKPEKANTLSATFGWHAAEREWELKATPYYTRVTDYIDAIQWNGTTNAPATTPTVGQFSVLKYVNQSARLYGLDVSGHMPLARTGVGNFGLVGLLGYTNGTNLDTGGNLYNIMPLNAKLKLTHKFGAWDNGIELVAVKTKNEVSDVRNEIRTPGYGLVNLRASYSWSQVRVDFGITNLFDKLYALPLGGAYIGQGTTMSLNTANMPWGIAVPGAGRSLYASLNVKF